MAKPKRTKASRLSTPSKGRYGSILKSRHFWLAQRQNSVDRPIDDDEEAKKASDQIAKTEAVKSLLGGLDFGNLKLLSRLKRDLAAYKKKKPNFSYTPPTEFYSENQEARIRKLSSLPLSEFFDASKSLLSSNDAEITLSEIFEKYHKHLHNDKVIDEADLNGDFERSISGSSASNRWSENERSSARFQMRVSKPLREHMDNAAASDGLDRSAWFSEVAEDFFRNFPNTIPNDYPDYRTSGVVNLRIPEELNKKLESMSDRFGVKKADLARRMIHKALVNRDAAAAFDISL